MHDSICQIFESFYCIVTQGVISCTLTGISQQAFDLWRLNYQSQSINRAKAESFSLSKNRDSKK